jgi:hypothetical protein
MDGQYIQMCDCTDLWRGRNVDGSRCEAHNVVTSVIGKKTFDQLGGFDEKIGVLEDTEFWLRAISRGVCGIRCPHPLMTYTDEGQFSAEIHSHPQFKKLLLGLYERNPNMGCMGCDSTPSGMPEPKGARQEDDVLVICTWGGNRDHVGRVTGRVYFRNGNNMLAWVDPRDVAAAPELYKIVEQVEPETEENLNDEEPEYDEANAQDAAALDETADVSDQRKTPDIQPSKSAERTVDGNVNTDDSGKKSTSRKK